MNARHVVICLVVASALLLGVGAALAQEPALEANPELLASVGTGFTYQGRLMVNGRPANGQYDLQFFLFPSSGPAIPLASTEVSDVQIANGTFSVVLDFGAGMFDGNARWISVGVRPAGSGDPYTSLSPRQQLRPAPYAMGLSLPMTQVVSSTLPLMTIANTHSGNAISASSATGDAILAQTDTNSDFYLFGIVPSAVVGRATAKGFGVRGTTVSGAGVVADITTVGGVGDLFVGRVWTAGGGLIGSYAHAFRVNNAGRVFANGGYQADGADVAEFIDASDAPEPGDVVEIDPANEGQYRRAATANSALVVGVISTDPGVSLGAQGGAEAEDARPQLALAGTTPVKVCDEGGPIMPGDLLVASLLSGHAMAAPADPAPGTVIGKALGSLDSGTGVMRMLVMLR